MEIIIDANNQFSNVQYTINNVHIQGNDNKSNRYYTLSDKLKFKLNESDTIHSSIPFFYKTDTGHCSASNKNDNLLHFTFGQNLFFSCFLELNKNQFVDFCKSQDSYPILSIPIIKTLIQRCYIPNRDYFPIFIFHLHIRSLYYFQKRESQTR